MSAISHMLPPPGLLARAIEASADLLLLVLRSGPDGPTVAGSNEAFRQLCGFDRDALDSMSLAELVPPQAETGVLRAIAASLAGAPGGRVCLPCRRVHGAVFVFEADALNTAEFGNGTLVLLGRDGTSQAREMERSTARL